MGNEFYANVVFLNRVSHHSFINANVAALAEKYVAPSLKYLPGNKSVDCKLVQELITEHSESYPNECKDQIQLLSAFRNNKAFESYYKILKMIENSQFK